jgi:toxin FitB
VDYMLDSDVLSQLAKGGRADPGVIAWLRSVEPDSLYLSVLTLGEIRVGVEQEVGRAPARAAALDRWLAEVTSNYSDRLLDVDGQVADEWGRMKARTKPGRTVPDIDCLIAATASVRGLVVVTGNTRHFKDLAVEVLNPFARRR